MWILFFFALPVILTTAYIRRVKINNANLIKWAEAEAAKMPEEEQAVDVNLFDCEEWDDNGCGGSLSLANMMWNDDDDNWMHDDPIFECNYDDDDYY